MCTFLHDILGLVTVVLLQAVFEFLLLGFDFFLEFLPELFFLFDSPIILLGVLLFLGVELLFECLDGLVVPARPHDILGALLLLQPLDFGPEPIQIRLDDQHLIGVRQCILQLLPFGLLVPDLKNHETAVPPCRDHILIV